MADLFAYHKIEYIQAKAKLLNSRQVEITAMDTRNCPYLTRRILFWLRINPINYASVLGNPPRWICRYQAGTMSQCPGSFGGCTGPGSADSRGSRSPGQFTGTGRRFEVLGEAGGVVVINDYAHHPTEIRATLSAARDRYSNRAFGWSGSPHLFPHPALFDGFSQAFGDADEVIVTEIFAAREPRQDFSSKQVVDAMPDPQFTSQAWTRPRSI